jgi:hypothetical protein
MAQQELGPDLKKPVAKKNVAYPLTAVISASLLKTLSLS